MANRVFPDNLADQVKLVRMVTRVSRVPLDQLGYQADNAKKKALRAGEVATDALARQVNGA